MANETGRSLFDSGESFTGTDGERYVIDSEGKPVLADDPTSGGGEGVVPGAGEANTGGTSLVPEAAPAVSTGSEQNSPVSPGSPDIIKPLKTEGNEELFARFRDYVNNLTPEELKALSEHYKNLVKMFDMLGSGYQKNKPIQ